MPGNVRLRTNPLNKRQLRRVINNDTMIKNIRGVIKNETATKFLITLMVKAEPDKRKAPTLSQYTSLKVVRNHIEKKWRDRLENLQSTARIKIQGETSVTLSDIKTKLKSHALDAKKIYKEMISDKPEALQRYIRKGSITEENITGEKAAIKKNLLPSQDSDGEKMKKIETYKQKKLDPEINGNSCIFLWGRTSGTAGGAHKELDSHKDMMLQIVKEMTSRFPGKKVIVVGDEVIKTKNELTGIAAEHQENVFILNKFWDDTDYGSHFKGDRNAQCYLFDLFPDDTVHIGMRSGSLEELALLDKNVVFIDDNGNNAQERMEFWAGNAAYARTQFMAPGKTGAEKNEHEEKYKGPIPHYKRVASRQKLGNEVDKRNAVDIGKQDFPGKLLGSSLTTDKFTSRNAKDLIEGLKEKSSTQITDDLLNEFNERFKEKKEKFYNETEPPSAGYIKYKTSEVQQLAGAVEFLESRNLLQDSELDQISYLVDYLTEGSQ